MNKMSKKIIAGIITLIIFLSGGTTIYIQDLGTKTGCHAGWVYEDIGEHEGYYKCLTQSNVRYEICFDVYNSSNTENYWCKKGTIIKEAVEAIEDVEKYVEEETKTNKYRCNYEGCQTILN